MDNTDQTPVKFELNHQNMRLTFEDGTQRIINIYDDQKDRFALLQKINKMEENYLNIVVEVENLKVQVDNLCTNLVNADIFKHKGGE